MADERLEVLKMKYQSALSMMSKLGVQLKNLHVQDNKLVMRGVAKSKADSFKVWNQIKLIDPNFAADLMAEITFLPEAEPVPPRRNRRHGSTWSRVAIRCPRSPRNITAMPANT